MRGGGEEEMGEEKEEDPCQLLPASFSFHRLLHPEIQAMAEVGNEEQEEEEEEVVVAAVEPSRRHRDVTFLS